MQRGLLIAVGLLLVAGAGYFALNRSPKPVAPVVIAPATAPATLPTSAPAPTPPGKPKNFLDVVRLQYPDFPTTQPLVIPLTRSEAAKLIIHDPLYVDANGELWITRSDAEPTSTVFKIVNEQSTHVTRENVVYVHRWLDASNTWWPQLICRKEDGSFEIVTRNGRQDIPGKYNYDWAHAYSWNEAIVVPTDRGVSVIRPDRRPMELYHEFVAADQYDPAKFSRPLSMLDWRGMIAWMPWENGKTGSRGAARLIDEKWTALNAEAKWPEKLLHLVPLLDGSIIQIVVDDQEKASVNLATLDAANLDEKKITGLVDQLSDLDPGKRSAAFNELTRYGISIWPILEKMLDEQSPEAKMRIRQLLRAKSQPTLGGMSLQPGPIKVLGRGDYGAVMLLSESGVEMPRENPDAQGRIVAPAYIDIEPGQPISLAANGLVEELQGKNRELIFLRGEIFVNDEAAGPRWWLSNHFDPLLKAKDLEYRHLVGQDGRGRWLFRKNLTDRSPTMVIDPTLPDPTPKLPVWIYKIEGGKVGWNPANWPAIKKGGAWALIKNDWHALDEAKADEKFYSRDNLPPELMPATAPTTAATTIASTAPSSQPSLGEPLMVEADGTRFYDGRQSLRIITKDGKDLTWELPPEAGGSATFEPVLFRAGENRLFLFNSIGRVLRIKPTPAGPQPFKLEATITRRIPSMENLDRIWLDPDGRIIIAHDGDTLSICFPTGRIPPELANKLPAGELKEMEE